MLTVLVEAGTYLKTYNYAWPHKGYLHDLTCQRTQTR